MKKITLKDFNEDPLVTVVIEYSLMGDVELYGFEKDGSWRLYAQDGWEPVYQVPIKLKGKKKYRWFLVSSILHCDDLEDAKKLRIVKEKK